MNIVEYTKNVNGKEVKFYRFRISTINIPTSRREAKCLSGFTSRRKAEEAYLNLWNKLRFELPECRKIQTWGKLKEIYLDSCDEKAWKGVEDCFSQHTISSKRSRLKHTDSWNKRTVNGITVHFVLSELDRMEEAGLSRNTTCEILKECKALLNYARDLGLIMTNPLDRARRRKSPPKRDCLNLEEANSLLSEAKKRSHPFYAVWLISIFTGLRRSELAGLKWTDINWEHGLALIQRQNIAGEGLVERLKGKRARHIALNVHLMTELKKMKLRAVGEFVIEFSPNEKVMEGRWRRGEQSQVLREFCVEIGLKEIKHHELRATHITIGLQDDITLGKLKEHVGHANIQTTNIYFRSAGVELKGAMDNLSVKVPSDGAEVVPLPASH